MLRLGVCRSGSHQHHHRLSPILYSCFWVDIDGGALVLQRLPHHERAGRQPDRLGLDLHGCRCFCPDYRASGIHLRFLGHSYWELMPRMQV